MEMVIETDKLTKSYDKNVVVNGLDLKVGKGEIFGFFGGLMVLVRRRR